MGSGGGGGGVYTIVSLCVSLVCFCCWGEGGGGYPHAFVHVYLSCVARFSSPK